jgi:hypothetical protein
MPLVWAATLAHYLPSLLDEAGRILPVSALQPVSYAIDALTPFFRWDAHTPTEQGLARVYVASSLGAIILSMKASARR